MAQSFLGTRGYLAPEMIQRLSYSKSIDMWALGVIVFVLLCGCLPFDDDSQPLPNEAILRQRFVLRYPRWAKNLSASAKDLLSHLLDIDPNSRYSAEQAMNHPWIQGETALKEILLQSPKQLGKSPGSIRSNKRKQSSPATHKRYPSKDYNTTYPTPPRHTGPVTYRNLIAPTSPPNPQGMVRKTSI